MIFRTNAKKASEADHRICDFAADFIDHYSFDRANVLLVSAVNSCSLYLVAADQGGGLPRTNGLGSRVHFRFLHAAQIAEVSRSNSAHPWQRKAGQAVPGSLSRHGDPAEQACQSKPSNARA